MTQSTISVGGLVLPFELTIEGVPFVKVSDFFDQLNKSEAEVENGGFWAKVQSLFTGPKPVAVKQPKTFLESYRILRNFCSTNNVGYYTYNPKTFTGPQAAADANNGPFWLNFIQARDNGVSCILYEEGPTEQA